MSDKHHSNITLLKEFVEINDLKDNHSNIHFNCEFDIETEKTNANVNCNARITFNNFSKNGEVSIICDLDANIYPTVFLAEHQNMELDNGILVITGKHPSNLIGKYTAIITAYDKV